MADGILSNSWTVLALMGIITTVCLGLIAWGIRLIFTGGIVPSAWHQEIVADRDGWRQAYQSLAAADQMRSEAVQIQANAIESQNEVGAFASAVMEAVRQQKSEEQP